MIKLFRYVIKYDNYVRCSEWMDATKICVAQACINKFVYNAIHGKKWYIEYKDVEK